MRSKKTHRIGTGVGAIVRIGLPSNYTAKKIVQYKISNGLENIKKAS